MEMNAIAMKAMRCSLALEGDVQPPVAAEPGERSFDHPTNAGRDEPSVAATGNGLDADAERLTDLGQPLAPVAEVAERRTFEATLGERAQDRHDPFGVMPVRRRDIDRQRDAVLVDRNMDLDAADLLAAIDAALKATRRRATGATVDHHSTRLRRIATSKVPTAASGSRASLPKPSPLRTGRDDCSSSGSSLSRAVRGTEGAAPATTCASIAGHAHWFVRCQGIV